MLRVAAKESVKCRARLSHSVIREASQSAAEPAGRGGSKIVSKLLGLTVLGSGVIGGVSAYSYIDPEFRKTVEDKIPQSKEFFNSTLGPPTRNALTPKEGVEAVGRYVTGTSHKLAEVTGVEKPQKKELTSSKPRTEIVPIVPVDLHKPVITPDPKKVSSAKAVKAAKEVERTLISQLESAQKVVAEATDAKLRTITSINEHSQFLKEAVDAGSNANWDKVREALEKTESLANADLALEARGRNALDTLKKAIASGKGSVDVKNAPILINARDTADKLVYQLDELNQMIQKSRNESRVFNQYKDLIDRSRKQFADELRAVVPNVDIHAKEKKLTEDELNALLAHAHLRVDQLKRQLTEQQLLEEKNIGKALEDQRFSDAKLSKSQLELELRRVREIQDVELERKLRDERKGWESDLEKRLQRAAAAHADNLEQVVRTQKQLHDIENAQAVDDAVEKERRVHSKQVELALEKLRGIEVALESRVALDVENRKAKQYWLACQNLHESIIFGQKAGSTSEERRKPLEKELSVLSKASEKDTFVQTIVKTFPQESFNKGVYTEQDLKQIFKQVYKVAFRIASVDENGRSLTKYLSSWIQSLFIVEFPRNFSVADKLDLQKLDNREILARVQYFVNKGDFLNAVRVAQLLEGPAAGVAKDWIANTRQHLEVRFLADLLLSHAAVTSIRSIY